MDQSEEISLEEQPLPSEAAKVARIVADKLETNIVPAAAESAENKCQEEDNGLIAELEAAKKEETSEIKLENLDELCSLEQEIAKMHNSTDTDHLATPVQDHASATTTSRSSSACENGNNDSKLQEELAHATIEIDSGLTHGQIKPVQVALDEVDLIALLKGSDDVDAAQKTKPDLSVAIEGEGQYEIMEIDDDDNSSEIQKPASSRTKKSSPSKTPVKMHNKHYGKTKLSPEEARAVALEQMADLNSRRGNVSANVKTLDIISTLNDDWNEYDSGSDSASNAATLIVATKPAIKNIDTSHLDTKPIVSNVVVVKAAPTQRPIVSLIEKPSSASAAPSAETETTGFRSTRIIKRKIIWDPDVPETHSQYATAKVPPKTPPPHPKPSNLLNTTVVVKIAKKEIAPKRARPVTPKERQRATSVLKESIKTPVKRAATPQTQSPAVAEVSTPQKRRSQTPGAGVPNGVGTGKKKKISEIDRLMGDEGAANMIQAVEHERREQSGGSDSRQAPNKPVMRMRAMTITGRPTQLATPKKEATVGTPKSTKRSPSVTATAIDAVFAQTSKAQQRGSDSWDYVYKQRASEESMIVRRRSNSSYSSNASVTRLSLDNKQNATLSDDASDADPSFKFLKPENKSNQRSGDADNVAHTLANDLKRSGGTQPKETKGKVELVALHKLDKVAHLIINTQRARTSHTYNTQLLHKLTETLNKVAKSNEYNTAVLSVQSGQQFCQGIDCQELLVASLEKRKNHAVQMASALQTYLKTLATFPKPLVAGIVGNLKNLGVLQLPLLDYVVAAKDCTFETSYAKIGQLPEGFALWQNHPRVCTDVSTRLFLLGEQLKTADIHASHGFINFTCQASSVNEQALAVAKRISTTTAENYRLLKKANQIGAANSGILDRLEEEFKILTDQWPTAGCQASIKRYLSEIEQQQ